MLTFDFMKMHRLAMIILVAALSPLILIQAACGREASSIAPANFIQVHPELGSIVVADTKLETLVNRANLLEGPVWGPGYLLFTDMRSHVIYRWHPQSRLSVFMRTPFTRTGPSGLAFDRENRLTICEHGNRRVSRLETDGNLTVLADSYNGKRLNSPNDLVYRSDGQLYFTDPPYGLRGKYADPEKELPFSGIFLLFEGKLELLNSELSGPNGLTFSPDEKYLYVGNDNHDKPVIQRFPVKSDGRLSRGEMFFDASSLTRAQWLDGMKSDIEGNLYVASSIGIIIIDATGKHLGTLQLPEPTNLAWGDDDEKGLYISAEKSLYRVRLKIPGSRGGQRQPPMPSL